MVYNVRPELADNFHIWNGDKILELLNQYPEVAERYGHFLTPGHVLAALRAHVQDAHASVDQILTVLVVRALNEQRHAKLDNAGAHDDEPPGVHRLFVDVPFQARISNNCELEDKVLSCLTQNSAGSRRIDPQVASEQWMRWRRHPCRARVWFLHGGPGRGKSTLTQYFCQVQRAALLLQGELKAAPVYTQLASDIRNQAQQAGFWPAVPRVPIYIELKEYAHWFGNRTQEQSVGVLTFLAERLTRVMDLPVMPGTINRALATQSWVVVFDGLDEVPQDTRQAVAREVCRFVDEVAVQADADLLTLCTSRPQGYANEFAELDGPTITLTDLDRREALAFGERVIRLTRSGDEADTRVAILRRAVQEGAVAELMTTPLQAHIMAVIVRDGGEPPEQRWGLFDRFYTVIHIREAAKRLPDKELSRVLSKEADLVRAVHNHLGFVLHVRAETSEGAVTHLSLDAFRELVERVVRQRREHGIDNTVDAVMRAARDRIVLINTPDDGAHVRFDIRQLQEFFAAEFVYREFADVKNHLAQLRERLECLANDVHWREVMHFVLSGIILRDLRSEFGVAIDVLHQLDGHHTEGGERIVNRHIGAGAQMVRALLLDGVLEADRRVRELFSDTLDSLAVSIHGISEVSRLRHESNHWISERMYQRLFDADYSVSTGAAVTLMLGLSGDDARVERVVNRILGAPTGYLANVIDGLDVHPALRRWESQGGNVPPWWEAIMIDFLSRNEWHIYSRSARLAASFLYRLYGEFTPKQGAKSIHHALVSLTEAMYVRHGLKMSQDQQPTNILTGWVQRERFALSFPARHPLFLRLADYIPDVEGLTGFFALAAAALLFAVQGSLTSYKRLLDEIGMYEDEGWSILSYLSRNLVVHIPQPNNECSPSQLQQELQDMVESDFAQVLANKKIGSRLVKDYYELVKAFDRGGSEEEFLQLLSDRPSLAVHIWLEAVAEGEYPEALSFYLSSEEEVFFAEEARAVLQRHSLREAVLATLQGKAEMIWFHPSAWGLVFAFMGPQSKPFRRSLCEHSAPISFMAGMGGFGRKWYVCELNLPEEHSLLVPIAGGLLDPRWSLGTWHIRDGSAQVSRHVKVCRGIATACSNLQALTDVADDTSVYPEIRAAAIVLGMLHEHGGFSVAVQRRDFLLSVCAESDSTEIVEAMIIAAAIIEAEAEPLVRTLIGELIDVSRDHYRKVKALQGALNRYWRTAHQPATGASAEHRWLQGV